MPCPEYLFDCKLIVQPSRRADACDPIRRIADRRCNSTDLGRRGTTAGETPCQYGGTGRRQPALTARPICRLGRLYGLAQRRQGLLRALQAGILEYRAGSRKRERAYIFIVTRPAEKIKNEVSVIVGYPFKSTSDATAEIGTAKFGMYTTNDGAWIKNVADEARMIDAMRKAADLTIKGTSGRGMQSTDRYSLKGLAQALDRAEQECK
jgi:Invasion associated locus B (IalB) protein